MGLSASRGSGVFAQVEAALWAEPAGSACVASRCWRDSSCFDLVSLVCLLWYSEHLLTCLMFAFRDSLKPQLASINCSQDIPLRPLSLNNPSAFQTEIGVVRLRQLLVSALRQPDILCCFSSLLTLSISFALLLASQPVSMDTPDVLQQLRCCLNDTWQCWASVQ